VCILQVVVVVVLVMHQPVQVDLAVVAQVLSITMQELQAHQTPVEVAEAEAGVVRMVVLVHWAAMEL
jgi:hypothetical protein